MKISKIAVLIIASLPMLCQAKLCKTMTVDGKVAFMFVNNVPTKTLSGTVSLLSLCPEQPVQIVYKTVEVIVPVEVTVPVYRSYEETSPRNKCEEVAKTSCDPAFGGLPLCNSNNFTSFCGFCFVATQGKVERYINGTLYEGSKVTNGVTSCPVK